jgi:hypothetical protein
MPPLPISASIRHPPTVVPINSSIGQHPAPRGGQQGIRTARMAADPSFPAVHIVFIREPLYRPPPGLQVIFPAVAACGPWRAIPVGTNPRQGDASGIVSVPKPSG